VGLAGLALPYTTITPAESIPAGTFQVPGQPPSSTTTFTDMPEFCRITATVSRVPGSTIGIEVWLPTTTWNGRYQQVGNHGFGGVFYWSEMAPTAARFRHRGDRYWTYR
jgi:feruloyl esterase